MPITPSEHPTFLQFEPWTGAVPAGFDVNFVGQHMDPTFDGALAPRSIAAKKASYPGISEETFEWIALLDAVSQADETFRMIELGAGYGRWLVAAACALRRKSQVIGKRPVTEMKLIGVEAEPTHFKWMKKHFTDNGIDPNDHKLFEAVVNAKGDHAHFIVGHGDTWYGQAIVPEGFVMSEFPDAKTIKIPAVHLNDLIGDDKIDLVDMDIQGAEQEVVEASIGTMTRKVHRAFVSTHSPEIHAAVGNSFKAAGWIPKAIHGWVDEFEPTEFGPINFQDGVQYWMNPNILRPKMFNLRQRLLAPIFGRFK